MGIGKEALPGSSREGRIEFGSAPPGGAVCLQHPPPALALPPPPAPFAEPGGAGSRSGGARAESRGSGCVGSRERRASVPLLVPPGVFHCAREERDPETAVQRDRQPTGPPDGPRAPEGAMSYQGKKSIPHITVSRAPTPPCCSLWGGGGRRQGRIRRGTAGAAPEAFCDAAGGAGPVSLALKPPPPASGDNGGGGSPAWQGGAGASGPSPRGLAAPPPPRDVLEDGVDREDTELNKRGRDAGSESPPSALEPPERGLHEVQLLDLAAEFLSC